MLEFMKPQIILASASPRRRELLSMLGLKFTILKPADDAEPPCLHSGRLLDKLPECNSPEECAALPLCTQYSGVLGRLGGQELASECKTVAMAAAAAGPYANLCLRLHADSEAACLAEAIEQVQQAALAKAESSSSLLEANRREETLIIGADTVVVCGQSVLGKPCSKEEAVSMLNGLAGRWHHVVTGTAVKLLPAGKCLKSCAVTAVKFRSNIDAEIRAYTDVGRPLDKAGAYGIQELGSLLVERIEGCYFNVVGLPLTVLNSLTNALGYSIFALRDSSI
ncbi:MAG: Maf family protein [Candidatus Bruticola sp.]